MKVIVLPGALCTPNLTGSAQFCIDVALQDSKPTHIWILDGAPADTARLAQAYPDLDVSLHALDTRIWPADLGSNPMLRLPILLKEVYLAAADDAAIEALYIPLHGAAGYCLHMAATGGILPGNPYIITTCFNPVSFERMSALTLPTQYSDVVTCEMETICAQQSNALWVSDALVKDSVKAVFNRPDDMPVTVFARGESPAPQKAALNGRHIIYCGPAEPGFGIDAFCDLAKAIDADGSLDKVSVITPTCEGRWMKTAKTGLSGLSAKFDWTQSHDMSEALSAISPGIVICPMRAPVVPHFIYAALDAGLPCIWGQGFDLRLPKSDRDGLTVCVSDARKIRAALDRLINPGAPQLPPAKLLPAPAPAAPAASQKRGPMTSLSVIVIHHNRPEKLRQALRSLSQQTHTDFELIVVDDGSTDASEPDLQAIIDSFAFTDAKLYQIENAYPSAARNHGAFHAAGEALFFVDDDNILDPRTLEAFLGALQSQDLVLSFYQTFQGDTPPALETSESLRPAVKGLSYGFAGLLPGAGLFFNILGNSSFMMRKDRFLELGGFSSHYGVGLEDYAFLLRASQMRDLRWVMLPEPYLHFRLHGDKIRNSHVDWKSDIRLQAGHWRLINDLSCQDFKGSRFSLAYARQLHEMTQYSYVPPSRPKFFRLRSVFLHHYIRPFFARHAGLRKTFTRFTGGESRFSRWIEKLMTK